MSLSILYLGPNSGTSLHRASALQRLGHRVSIVDPLRFLPNTPLLNYYIHHTGALPLQRLVREKLLNYVKSARFDLVFVNGGYLLDRILATELKNRFGLIVNYNIDDPFGKRDGAKWRGYLDALSYYGLVAVVRDCNVQEAFSAGARKVLRVYMSADEVAHAPRRLTQEDRDNWASDVLFVGTWMPERGPFLARLIELGVPLSIYGDRWRKDEQWRILRTCWRGPGLHIDDDYAHAIQSAKLCLGLLSKGNRDLSTTRSFEIPHLGGILCAERTQEHMALYREDQEALFWSTPEECAQKCHYLLNNPHLRDSIAEAGRLRCVKNQTTNQQVLARILSAATSPKSSGQTESSL